MLEKEILTNSKQIEFDLTTLPTNIKNKIIYRFKLSGNLEVTRMLSSYKTLEEIKDLNLDKINYTYILLFIKILNEILETEKESFGIEKRAKIIALKNKLIVSIIVSD